MKATALSLKALIKGNTQINNAKKPPKNQVKQEQLKKKGGKQFS